MILELALAASLSSSAGFSSPPVGVEFAVEPRVFSGHTLRLEAGYFEVAKEDGGTGRAFQVAAILRGQKLFGGIQFTEIDVERYSRQDWWVVAGYRALRVEIEQESWRVLLRPTLTFNHFFVRPEVGFTEGRGSSGVIGKVSVGATW